MIFVTGTKVGPYEILSQLGAGGQGEVYKARDARLNRFVAIKVLPDNLSQNPELKSRFEREAQTLASLSHPHICPVFDVGNQDGIDFIVMEFLEGVTLAERLEKGALPLQEALTTAIEIADALDKAHRQGVTHRDVKPGNVILTKNGSKLLDFGLAKLKQTVEASSLSSLPTRAEMTADGAILGTLQYMAPEQLEGKESDARTDIFAFGAVLYEMVTGKKPFEGKSQASLIAGILEREPPSLLALQPMTPASLDHVVQKCLAKNPEGRWQTSLDLLGELKWVRETGRQAPVEVAPARSVFGERIGLIAAAAVLLIAGAAAGLLYSYRAKPNEHLLRLSIPAPDNAVFS